MTGIVVVTAIGGAQQAAVAEAFRGGGWRVRGTARAGNGADVVAADLKDPEALARAFDGAAVVAATLPQDHRPGAMVCVAEAVATAAGRAGVGRLVLNLGGTLDEAGDAPLARDLRQARAAVLGGEAPGVTIQPTVFLDNFHQPWAVSAIAGGVLPYPAPENAPVSWLSHRTLAEFVLAAAMRDEVLGRDLRVGGPDALTGPELARRMGAAIGRDLHYARVPLDQFAAGVDAGLGAPAGARIASLYEWLEREPDALNVGREVADALGVQPESVEAFAARQDWAP